MDTLTSHLRDLGYEVHSASSAVSKVKRLLEMLLLVWRRGTKNSVVLIDTYSTQNFYYALLVAWLCSIKGLRYCPILHGGNLPKRLERNPWMSKKIFGHAYRNIAPSAYLLTAFKQFGYDNTSLIPNAIEVNAYSFKERKEIGPKLLWVRSFASLYNPMLALKTIKLLKADYPDITLCMVGPDKDGSLELCKSYAIENKLNVEFTGKLDKEQWKGLSTEYDIFINTTNFDNTPVSVLEALCLGLPVVSTNVGGIPFMLENDKNALLVPPNDEHALKKAIEKLLGDSSLAHLLSKEGRQLVQSYDWDVVKHQWITLLGNK